VFISLFAHLIDNGRLQVIFRPMGEKIPGKLLRAARELLDWDQPRLAQESGCSLSTVARIERGDAGHWEDTRAKLVETMEAAGVEFLPQTETKGAGVRWSTPDRQAEHVIKDYRRERRAAKRQASKNATS
jgi:transcriptional regulator with XRE-family HTH domain